METKKFTPITVQVTVHAPIEKVWNCWNLPEHIIKWNFASDDWHCPRSENDLRVDGKFLGRMEAKDGSFGFDFEGTYLAVDNHQLIEYLMADGRKAKITFEGNGKETIVTETFDAEKVNPIELQRGGWQAILNNFKKHVESI